MATKIKTKTWLETVPVLPLERSVPAMVREKGEWWPAVIKRSDDYSATTYAPERTYPLMDTRVDLDNPQGFFYAVRLLADRGRGRTVPFQGGRFDIDHFCSGLIHILFQWHACNDADRLALAQVLAAAVDDGVL